MDPLDTNSLQDVIRCHMCDSPVPPLYCDICQFNLCKNCAGEHLVDESKFHLVVLIKHRKPNYTYSYPKCAEHTTKLCELHWEQCNIPVCVQCVSSKKHKAHDVEDILKFMERKNKALKADLEELGKIIYPKYQQIVSNFSVQRADLNRHIEKLRSCLDKRGQDWHREIDNIVRKLKSDIQEMESEQLSVLKKQEDEIKQSVLETTQIIFKMKKILDSNDVYLLSEYKSRNVEFRKLPPKLIVSLPTFTPRRINTEKLSKQFGSLSAPSFSKKANFSSLNITLFHDLLEQDDSFESTVQDETYEGKDSDFF